MEHAVGQREIAGATDVDLPCEVRAAVLLECAARDVERFRNEQSIIKVIAARVVVRRCPVVTPNAQNAIAMFSARLLKRAESAQPPCNDDVRGNQVASRKKVFTLSIILTGEVQKSGDVIS